MADWIRTATNRLWEWLYREERARAYEEGFCVGFVEGYLQGYADAKAGLPPLPPGSEYNSLCRMGLTAYNTADSDSPPVKDS